MDERSGRSRECIRGKTVTSRTLKMSDRQGCTRQGQEIAGELEMKLETRIFDLCHGRYSNLTELAKAMRISVSQLYRVRQRKRPINEKFITGTLRAFPGYKLDDLFCVVPDRRQYGRRQ